ncbi:MAG: TlpA family protein disulfide reductase [Candidatus Eremiobacteraeota bacterium]|nr:TlpA family protein disulfide reductase [Candidatus Eremiobacteraeota bacterium]
MHRTEFVYGLSAALAMSTVPNAGHCIKNDALPYDRPLELKMRALDGPDFVLSEYAGCSIWLNVFATWCPPCVAEQPFVVQASRAYFDRGLRVIGIDFAEADDTVRYYRRRFGITYPIAMDVNGGFCRALEVGKSSDNMVFPAQVFITPDGFLQCYVIGSMGDAEMTARIEGLLSAVTLPSPAPPSPMSPQPNASPGLRTTFLPHRHPDNPSARIWAETRKVSGYNK